MAPNRSQSPPTPCDGRQLVGSTLVGRYFIRSVLGVGGKGTVYEADDTTMQRTVAIKVPTLDKEDTIKRFLREGRAGAAVAHPNVCAIFDFGPLEDGTPFLAMEHLKGETLSERLERQPKLPLALALHFLVELLSGLSAAHAQGIVHRDVKPGNVFLARIAGYQESVVKLLDFGASTLDPEHAKEEEDFEALTKIGTAIGTPTYMAPEQVRGQRDLDARVDVYACGVILYEALAGRRPFEAEKRPELFRKILRGELLPVCSLDPRLPKAVDAVIGRAMACKRDDRYPGVAAFASALESLQRETLKLSVPTPAVLTPVGSERLEPLKRRLEEVSSLYLSADSQSSLRIARRSQTSVDIPIVVEEDEPPTTRDPSLDDDDDDDDDGPTRRDG